MSGPGWYKRDPKDFLEDVQGLGPELIGAYAVILDLIYARDGNLPRDDRHLAGVMGCSIRKARALTDDLIAAKKLTEADGRLTNGRADKEIFERKKWLEKSAKGGRSKAENASADNEINEIAPSNKIRLDKSRKREPIGSQKRGSRLPPDWTLPDDLREWAELQGWPPPVIEAEAEKMRDWSQNARTGAKIDWFAAWRNWMRDKPKVVAINGGWHGQRSHEPHRLQRIVTAAAAGTSGKGWG